jgi:hypothetical protein
MPDRCEVLPGDAVVARRGGGLLWVDAPGSPALVAALHACLGVSGPGADRVLAAVAGQVSSLAHGTSSFALVLTDATGSGSGTGVALWSGKGAPAVDGVPVSGSSVEGCTLASGFALGQTLYVGPGQAAPQIPPGVAYDLIEGTVPGSGATLQLAAAAPSSSAAVPAASPSSFGAPSDAGFGSAREPAGATRADSGEQTAFWRPDAPAAAPVLRFDDGMVVTVDEDLVLGRRPDNHELVTSGSARPVPIADTQNVLSSAHAALQRAGREVSLVDLGSLNGTHVAGPEATEWTQLEPGVAHPLADGDRLLLGWTVITFEQPQD